jgi:hypothetical protein
MVIDTSLLRHEGRAWYVARVRDAGRIVERA